MFVWIGRQDTTQISGKSIVAPNVEPNMRHPHNSEVKLRRSKEQTFDTSAMIVELLVARARLFGLSEPGLLKRTSKHP